MNKSKLLVLWVLTFLAGLVAGGACMYGLRSKSTPRAGAPVERLTQELLSVDSLQHARVSDEFVDEEGAAAPRSSAELPSHLVRSDLPKDIVLGAKGVQPAAPEETSGIVLSDAQNAIVLNARKPAQQASDGSSVTLIEAPVGVKRIQTLDQYKAFKTQARGSYPTADFAKEEVIVLESTSNLPDKMFEIVSITPTQDSLLVTYRVNVFGLDKKLNTHSAQKISKSKLPVVLQQVL